MSEAHEAPALLDLPSRRVEFLIVTSSRKEIKQCKVMHYASERGKKVEIS